MEPPMRKVLKFSRRGHENSLEGFAVACILLHSPLQTQSPASQVPRTRTSAGSSATMSARHPGANRPISPSSPRKFAGTADAYRSARVSGRPSNFRQLRTAVAISNAVPASVPSARTQALPCAVLRAAIPETNRGFVEPRRSHHVLIRRMDGMDHGCRCPIERAEPDGGPYHRH